jgi:hypothetical protein
MGAVPKRWAAVRIAAQIHLVGVLVGGHTRLEAGCWVITSAVIAYDRTIMTAVTGSSGRTYHLFEQLEMPLPSELLDLLAEALRVWRLPVTKIEFIELRTTAALDRCRPPGDLSGLDERRRRGRQMSSLSEAQDDQTRLLGALPRVRPDAGLQAS